jgi:multicomponent Na+:H+ antiporter subunit C
MTVLSAIWVGVLFGGAIYLILQRQWLEILLGFVLLTHAGSIFVLALSGSPLKKLAPLVAHSSPFGYVDPVLQALILTAVVIGFGISAFMIIMVYRLMTHEPTKEADDVE